MKGKSASSLQLLQLYKYRTYTWYFFCPQYQRDGRAPSTHGAFHIAELKAACITSALLLMITPCHESKPIRTTGHTTTQTTAACCCTLENRLWINLTKNKHTTPSVQPTANEPAIVCFWEHKFTCFKGTKIETCSENWTKTKCQRRDGCIIRQLPQHTTKNSKVQ